MRVLFWPFRVVWSLLGLMGRLAAACLGIVFMILGFVLTVTVLGAAIGIPLIIFGLLLVIRAIF